MARRKREPHADETAEQRDADGGQEAAASAPKPKPEPNVSLDAFLRSTRMERTYADVLRSLAPREKHTLDGWRQRLRNILQRPLGGSE